MKKLTLGLSALALVVIAGGTAFAAGHGAGHGMRGGDADGNGTVSRSEAQTHAAAMFTRMDANNDGKVDPADRSAREGERFARLDINKDGQLSRDEFAAGHQRGPEARGGGEAHGDHAARGDGQRMGGWRSHRGGHGGGGKLLLGMADANKDGAVTQAEFSAAHAQHFTMIDANKDGSINAEERKAARAKMREHMRTAPAAGTAPGGA